jgi:cytochrome c oxidase subunit 2
VVPLLAALALAGCAENYPQTTLLARGDFARLVNSVFFTTVGWATLVFILVEGALLLAIVRFRAKPGAPEPKQTHGNTAVEVVWTMIPAVILAMIAVPTVRTIFLTAEEPKDALQIEVIGHQWWWEFRYPSLNIVTANEIHVPQGQTVSLQMTTADVIHSFWVPQFAGKRDLFPKRHNNLWFKAEVTGNFTGQCAEFCGVQHGRMGFRIISQTPDEFQQWAQRQQVGSPLNQGGAVADSALAASLVAAGVPAAGLDSILAKGKAAFMAGGCIGCHAMVGTPTAGVTALLGPNLSHVGSRTTLVAGMMPNTPENVSRWLHDPQAVKVGSLMVLPRKLTEDEIATLVAYLEVHK